MALSVPLLYLLSYGPALRFFGSDMQRAPLYSRYLSWWRMRLNNTMMGGRQLWVHSSSPVTIRHAGDCAIVDLAPFVFTLDGERLLLADTEFARVPADARIVVLTVDEGTFSFSFATPLGGGIVAALTSFTR